LQPRKREPCLVNKPRDDLRIGLGSLQVHPFPDEGVKQIPLKIVECVCRCLGRGTAAHAVFVAVLLSVVVSVLRLLGRVMPATKDRKV
jgi:hypothetical protein